MSEADPQPLSPTLVELLAELAALEALGASWGEAERNGAQARAEAIDALNAEAFRRLIRSLRDVPGCAEALRNAAADDLVYCVLRRHNILKPSLFERVDAALATVRPTLAGHGGDAQLVEVSGDRAVVRFLGACDGCPASALTFYAGVKRAITEQVPEIREVKQAKGLGGGGDGVHFTSPFAVHDQEGWTRAWALADLPDGDTRIIELDGHSLLLSRFGDTVTCFENACAHLGMAMDHGEIAQGFITCPHHGFRYALESGECLTAPEVQLQPHAVRVRGDAVELRLAR